jgi:hypothetical protein
MITKTQGVYSVGVGDAQVIPGRKEWTWDKHDNACVRQDLTKWQTYYGQVRTNYSIETPRTTFLFWLRISSNTPSYSEEGYEWDPRLANPIYECAF